MAVGAAAIYYLAGGMILSYFLAVVLAPLTVLAVSFRLITQTRIRRIRDQLTTIIETLREFEVDNGDTVHFSTSSFNVINRLNRQLLDLIEQARANFQTKKQFTQNASHELQTPLAIIKGHVETLLQSSNLGDEEMKSLAIVLQNTNRLSKISSALILLSKIEQQRFSDEKEVNFSELTQRVLALFRDMIELKGISVVRIGHPAFRATMSEALAEILLTNLIHNAIRHNLAQGGSIQIEAQDHTFTISNTGRPLRSDPAEMFLRFHRESDSEESLGLGLSIVERICKTHQLRVTYSYIKDRHVIQLSHENQK